MYERLTAISPKNGMAYLVNVKPDEQDVESSYPNTLRCIMDSFNRLAAYEDSGLSPEQVQELAQAKADGRLVVLPEGYEHAEEFYHVVNLPKWCDEDGNGCEDCRHEVCNGDGASIDCTFKPYVSKIGANAVFDALYTLNGLSLSKESAEKALGGKDDA